MPEEVKIQLTKPIQAHGETVAEITLRPLDAGMLRKIKGNPSEDIFSMAAQYVEISGNIPKSSVDQIDGSDFMKCVSVFGRFFADGQTTG